MECATQGSDCVRHGPCVVHGKATDYDSRPSGLFLLYTGFQPFAVLNYEYATVITQSTFFPALAREL